MVKSGHPGAGARVVPVTYDNQARPDSHVDVLSVQSIFSRLVEVAATQVERTGFQIWALITAGTCQHMVDFELYPCGPGTVLRVRSDQVHRWDTQASLRGVVLLVTPEFLPPSPARQVSLLHRLLDHPSWPVTVQVPSAHGPRVASSFRRLANTYATADASEASTELLHHLASATLLDVVRSVDVSLDDLTADPRVAAFRRDIERSYRVTRQVGDYAQRLGISTKTLDRLCRAETGQSAKRVITERVLLEARRLLAHTHATHELIAAELGFSESTNFSKFFIKHTGSQPRAFRQRFRS